MGSVEKFCNQQLVEYASLLYGADWRDSLAQQLGVGRRQLVLMLASDEPIPLEMLKLTEESMQVRLDQLQKNHARLKSYLRELVASDAEKRRAATLPTVSRTKAC